MEQIQIECKLPSEPFIAVFGTSHTHGDCLDKDKKHIPGNHIWASQVSRKISIPVVNFSIPGNDNATILEQINSFFEQPGWENCRLIISEVRWGDSTTKLSHSVFSDFDTSRPDKTIPSLWAGRDFHQLWWKQHVYLNIAMSKMNQSYARDILKTPLKVSSDQVPDQAVKILMDHCQSYSAMVNTGHQPLLDDMRSIRAMSSIVNAHKIPFLWFVWSTTKVNRTGNKNTKYLLEIFNKTTQMFESSAKGVWPNVAEVFTDKFGQKVFDSTLCECRHNNSLMHSWVADNILSDVQQALNR
jgi:hypothetical protein